MMQAKISSKVSYNNPIKRSLYFLSEIRARCKFGLAHYLNTLSLSTLKQKGGVKIK